MTSTSHFIKKSFYATACVVAALCVIPLFGHAENSSHSARKNNAVTQLGKSLFFDKRLSSDGTTNCASCHDPAHAFTDAKVTSIGAHSQAGTRNALSLLHLTDTSLFWDGRGKTLEDVVSQPFSNKVEMGLSGEKELLDKLKAAPYPQNFRDAFPGEKGPSIVQIRMALAAYLRSLRRGTSAYDRYAQGDHLSLTPEAQQGFSLFSGIAGCSS